MLSDRTVAAVAALLLAPMLVAGWHLFLSQASQSFTPVAAPFANSADERAHDRRMTIRGVHRPVTIPARAAKLADDAVVLGVVIAGEARAYPVSAMRAVNSHVVNDLIAGAPVSVTYCDRNDSARVLTNTSGGKAIDLWVGGWREQQLVLMLNERMYPQDSADLPLDDLPVERTTWKQWRDAHPQTTVYSGERIEDE